MSDWTSCGLHTDEHSTCEGVPELRGVGVSVAHTGRVKDERGAWQTVVELGEPLESYGITPEQMHDPERSENAPVIRLRVVSERCEHLPGRSVGARRGIEVQTRIVDVGIADDRVDGIVLPRRVDANDIGEVADPHVVRDEREVVASEDLLRFGQVAHRAGERLLRIEARVHLSALGTNTGGFGVVAAANRLVQ